MNRGINLPIEVERVESPCAGVPGSPLCLQYKVVENKHSRSWGAHVTVKCEAYHEQAYEALCPFCQTLVKFERRNLIQGFGDFTGGCPHARKVIDIPRPCVLAWGAVLVEFSQTQAVANALHSPTVEDLRAALRVFSLADVEELEKAAAHREAAATPNDKWPMRGYALDIAAEWRKEHNYPKEVRS